jgi:hypothetical protein
MHLKMTPMSAALAALAVAVSPARVLAAQPTTHKRPHATVTAVRSARSGEPDDGGSVGLVTTRRRGSDDGGSDDGLTTRTSRMKPVGGVGPVLGGSSSSASTRPKTQNGRHAAHPRNRTNGAANGGGDD